MSVSADRESNPPRARVFSTRWWTGERGWPGIAQWPNPALAVWLLATIVGWTGIVDDASRSAALAGVGHGALVVWALDELVRGTSPLRRLLGAVILAVQLFRLFA